MSNRSGLVEIVMQQGDVQLFPNALPNGLIRLDHNVVQEGEHTGHAHRLYDGEFELYEDKNKARFLRVLTPVSLKHEEHHAKTIPPGDYHIGIVQQWDYDSQESRRVVD